MPEPSPADTLIDELRRFDAPTNRLASERQADPDPAERLARRLHDIEIHRRDQDRELGHGLGL